MSQPRLSSDGKFHHHQHHRCHRHSTVVPVVSFMCMCVSLYYTAAACTRIEEWWLKCQHWLFKRLKEILADCMGIPCVIVLSPGGYSTSEDCKDHSSQSGPTPAGT
jgi:hypothetical protein